MNYLNAFLSTILAAFTLSLTVFQFANAAEVSKIKGSQVLIDNEGETFTEDQILSSKDGEVEVKLKKVKPDKSLAETLKGNPSLGMKLAPKPKNKSTSKKTTKKQKSKSSDEQRTGLKLILFVGTSSQKMTIKDAGTEYSLKGTNSFFEFAIAYPLSEQLEILGLFGRIPFNVKYTVANAEASTDITYTKLGGLIRYSFVPGDIKLWVGGGLNYLAASSKKSTVLNEDKIGAQQSVSFSFGGDFSIGPGMSIPLVGEYALFPASSSVTANETRIYTGFSYQLQ